MSGLSFQFYFIFYFADSFPRQLPERGLIAKTIFSNVFAAVLLPGIEKQSV
jgi:hypothetical protein